MKGWIGFAVAMAGALVLAVLGTTPPSPRPASTATSEFSAGRAMADVSRIAARPHSTGTPENAAVRAYLVERLRGLGLEVRETEYDLPVKSQERMAKWSKGAHRPTRMTNIIGVLPGSDRNLPAVALMAHHDTVWGSPGAADDTAGVATILETVRAIKVSGQPMRDLMVVITDAEELGLSGAEAFFASDPARSRIGTVVNMEARGGGGRTTLFQTSPQNGAAVRLYADSVSHPGGSSLAAFIYSVLPNDTDLSVSLRADYPGYNFAFIGRSGLYHSPKATPDALDQGALQDMGAQVLGMTKALVNAQTLPERSANVVFFDLFGLFMAIYPVWIGWLILGGTVIGLGLAMRGCRGKQVAEGAARMFVLLFGTGFVLFLLNLLSGAGAGANYYDRLAAIPKLEVMAAAACAAMFLLLFRTQQIPARQVGAVLPLLLLGAAVQAFATVASYVILIPLMLVAICLNLKGQAAVVFQVVTAAVVFGYQLYLGHFVMQGVGPTMPFAVVLPLALAALAVMQVWPGLTRRGGRRSAVALLVIAVAVSLWVRFDPMADTIAVYSSDKAAEPIPITKPGS
jgi:hypothetical protein